MNTTPTDEVVLKQDVLGRVKTPKARWEQLLDEFERSGLPSAPMVAPLLAKLKQNGILHTVREGAGHRPHVLALAELINSCEGKKVF